MSTDTAANLIAEADAILAAGEKFADRLPRAADPYPRKSCTRCGGKGFAYFLGNDRAPGDCFKCAGKGTVSTMPRAEATRVHATHEVERLRALYRSLTLALSFARAAVVAGGSWAATNMVRDIERRLARIAEAGKAAAALAKA